MIRSLTATIIVGFALLGCAATPAATGVTRDFVATTTAGDEVNGASFREHVTIIDFWAVF